MVDLLRQPKNKVNGTEADLIDEKVLQASIKKYTFEENGEELIHYNKAIKLINIIYKAGIQRNLDNNTKIEHRNGDDLESFRSKASKNLTY